MACNNADGCCTPAMCANGGSQLNCIFNDIGTLVKPFAPAINQRITNRQPTVAGSLGQFSVNQLFVFGILIFGAIFFFEHGPK